MKSYTCERCGASDFFEQKGYIICKYCDTKYILRAEDMPSRSSNIALKDDISMLLKKCRDDPVNARRYASLVLDIDPGNVEAAKYAK